jgi:protein arginine N-methyltransferase 1
MFHQRFTSSRGLRRLEIAAVEAARRTIRAIRSVPAVRREAYRVSNRDGFGNIAWHDGMLGDRVRLRAYARAIDRYVQPGMVVVDLGTGSGVLACLAAQRGAHVHAIEHTDVIHHARELARTNDLASSITFHQLHSRDFQAPGPVDVILHEQVGHNLVDEDMVENVVSLRERVLAPNGRVLPARFELFVDPVQLREDRTIPYSWEHRFHGLDFSCFAPARGTMPGMDDGSDKRWIAPGDVERNLAPERSVLRFDLGTMKRDALPVRLAYDTAFAASGRLDGFAQYFEIAFDDELRFKTGPDHPRTHWDARLLRTEARDVAAGERLVFEMIAEDPTDPQRWPWSYTIG